MAVVRASIERLFATGRYADIQVDAEPYTGGVIVKFITTNSWFIGRRVRSPAKVETRPTADNWPTRRRLELGQPIRWRQLEPADRQQRRLLESNGLYLELTIQPVFDYDRCISR